MARSHRLPARARRLGVAVAALIVLAGCGADDATVEPADVEPADLEATDVEPADAPTDVEPADLEATDAEPADEPSDIGGDELFPDVLDAEATQDADGTWRFDVTLSSPYDTPERYADAWRVLGPDGSELGVRELLHDHQFEQPFTRSLSGVVIPDGITSVTIEGRDQRSGWGGATFELELP